MSSTKVFREENKKQYFFVVIHKGLIIDMSKKNILIKVRKALFEFKGITIDDMLT